MKNSKLELFVGGPAAGKHKEVDRGVNYFNVAESPSLSDIANTPYEAAEGVKLTLRTFRYARRHFRTMEGAFSFFAPEHLSDLAVFTGLLKFYEDNCNSAG